MDVTRDPAQFRPVSIRLETQDELDQLLAIIHNVANNKVNHLPSVIRAAQCMQETLNQLLEAEES